MRVACFLSLVLVGLVACDRPSVEWSDPVAIDQAAGATQLVVDSSGSARFVADTIRAASSPATPGLCATSLRLALAAQHLYASWWSVRRDSSAGLFAAQSTDGGHTWTAPMSIDTSDVATAGCSRPAPALATVGDDLFVAYSMAAPEGMGVFSAHTMGGMLHSPVAAIYGDRLVDVAIAALGDRVAVAYDEPNGTHPRIDVALSATQGHIFESHVIASRAVDEPFAPAVALSSRNIAVSWLVKTPSGGATSRVVRVGQLTGP